MCGSDGESFWCFGWFFFGPSSVDAMENRASSVPLKSDLWLTRICTCIFDQETAEGEHMFKLFVIPVQRKNAHTFESVGRVGLVFSTMRKYSFIFAISFSNSAYRSASKYASSTRTCSSSAIFASSPPSAIILELYVNVSVRCWSVIVQLAC